jgi:hypothetical protein
LQSRLTRSCNHASVQGANHTLTAEVASTHFFLVANHSHVGSNHTLFHVVITATRRYKPLFFAN